MVRTGHTAELDAATLVAARALLDEVFAGELTDADWEHGLGGVHALAYEGEELVGHASLIQRRLLYDGRAHASARLVVPHPGLLERRFVLIPLLELDFGLATPDGTRLADALAALPVVEGVRRAGAPLALPAR